jgi:hypothetical protein
MIGLTDTFTKRKLSIPVLVWNASLQYHSCMVLFELGQSTVKRNQHVGELHAWLDMDRWLGNFAYRIHVGWLHVSSNILMVLLITSVTVLVLSSRAAMQKPAIAIKYETFSTGLLLFFLMKFS